MKPNYVKGGSLDKWEAWRPSGQHFVHTNSDISREDALFSVKAGYAWDQRRRTRGFNYGVDKKLYLVSGQGINIDNIYIGKSDE